MPTESDSLLERPDAPPPSSDGSGLPSHRGTGGDPSRYIDTIFSPAIDIYRELKPIRAGDVSSVDPCFFEQTIGKAERTLRQAIKVLTADELSQMPAAAAAAIREILAVLRQAERESIGFGDACLFYAEQPVLMTAGEAGWKAIKNQRPSELDGLAAHLDAMQSATKTDDAMRPTDFDGRLRYLTDALRRLYEKGTDRVHLAELGGRLVVDCDVPEQGAESLAKVFVRQFFAAGCLEYWQKPSRGLAMYGAEPTWCEFRILPAIRLVAATDNAQADVQTGSESAADLPKPTTVNAAALRPSDEAQVHSPAKKAKRSTNRGEGRLKLIAALTLHHQYADSGSLHLEPIGNNQLAELADVSRSTASQFFNKEFNKGEPGGYSRYRTCCRDTPSLVLSLQTLNQELSPHHFLCGDPSDGREGKGDE